MHRVMREQVLFHHPTPISAMRVSHHEDLPVHGHAFMELAVVVGGTATHISATGSQGIERGSIIALRPGEWHGYKDCDHLEIIDVYLGPELFVAELSWIADDPQLGTVLRPPRPGQATLTTGETRVDDDALARLHQWSTPLMSPFMSGNRDRITRIGYLILILGEMASALTGATEAGRIPAAAHPSVVRAARLLECELTRRWTLTDLASAVNLAPAYLVRLFARQVGLPPIAYLNRLRAEQAGVLLIETDLSVAVIGARVGWGDPTYTSRRFKACFAITPAAYRSAFRLLS